MWCVCVLLLGLFLLSLSLSLSWGGGCLLIVHGSLCLAKCPCHLWSSLVCINYPAHCRLARPLCSLVVHSCTKISHVFSVLDNIILPLYPTCTSHSHFGINVFRWFSQCFMTSFMKEKTLECEQKYVQYTYI